MKTWSTDGLDACRCELCKLQHRGLKLLHCHHSICPSCIRSSGGSQISCPTCEKATDGKAIAGGELRMNSFAESLFKFHDTMDCSVCSIHGRSGIPALYTCEKCSLAMCEECIEMHNSLHSNHTVVPTQGELKFDGQTKQACKVHPEKLIELFCTACEHFVCVLCRLVAGSSQCSGDPTGKHNWIDLKKALMLNKASLRNQVEAIKKELSEVQETMASLMANLRKVTSDGATMKERILKQKESIQKVLDQRAEQLLKEVDDLTSSRKSILEVTLQKQQDHLSKKEALCSEFLCAVEHNNPVKLQEQVERSMEAKNIAPPEGKSSFPDVAYESITDISSFQANLRDLMGHLVETVELVQPEECTSIADVAYSPFTNSFYVAGHSSGVWRESGGKLYRMDERESSGICISHDGQVLYSASHRLVAVFILNVTGPHKEERSIRVGVPTHGVCLSLGGRLAVTSWESRKLLIYNKPGSAGKEIRGVCSGGKPLFGVWSGEDQLCLTVAIRWGKDKVVCVQLECQYVLWQVDVDRCRSISFIDRLLYVQNRSEGTIEVFSDGKKLVSLASKDLVKMIAPASGNKNGPLRAVRCSLKP